MLGPAQIPDRHRGYVVDVFYDDPPAWTECLRQLREYRITFGEVLEHKSSVHEIKSAYLKSIMDNVMPANLRTRWALDRFERSDIDVCGHDLTRIADELAQPGRDRPAAGTDFEAPNAGADAQSAHQSLRSFIEQLFSGVDAGVLVGVKYVWRRLFAHSSVLSV